MKIFSELRKISSFLSKKHNNWAICGGIAASLYRKLPRLTTDIDIAITNSESLKAKEAAKEALKILGYKPAYGFIPHPDGSGRQCNALVMCRVSDRHRYLKLLFVLSNFNL